jgi:hypothetical protein
VRLSIINYWFRILRRHQAILPYLILARGGEVTKKQPRLPFGDDIKAPTLLVFSRRKGVGNVPETITGHRSGNELLGR